MCVHGGSDVYSLHPTNWPNRPYRVTSTPIPHVGHTVGGRLHEAFVHLARPPAGTA